jgi:hypothetical protein
MEEVTERRSDAPEQARQPPCHPELLHPPREKDRLDAVGDEVRPACDGCQAQILGGRGKRSEELLHVRLVPGSPPPEDVRVDDDERPAQASASR